jgi:outer membrane protein OmpA-like peptidoglycan-associated protein
MAGEVGFGWGFSLGRISLGPTLRYLQMKEKNFSLEGNDAKLLVIGVELALGKTSKIEPKTTVTVEKIAKEESDTDGDKIPDLTDKCPTEPEDKDGFEDDNGCPELDNDKDGLTDVVDKCPNQPETMNGVDDLDGCPETASTTVKEERLSYEEHVLFDSNSTQIRPEVQPILWAIVTLWKQHPEWDRLVIEGHADQRGSEEYNNWLSQERALQTRAVLIAMGFPANKIEVAGYGNRLPLKPGNDESTLKENRRVELIIIPKKTNAAGAMPPQTPGGGQP